MVANKGFTLVELLVVIAIAAVLASVAAPSMSAFIQSNRIRGAVGTFVSDMRFARAEAIKRGGGVVLCRSDSPESSAASCSTGSALHGWVSGWIVFHDLDSNGQRNGAEPLLRVQVPWPGVDDIVEFNSSGVQQTSTTAFKFVATGRFASLASATTLRFGGANYPVSRRQTVCVSLGGRVRVAGDGATTCSS